MDRKKLQKLVNELSDELKRGESMVAESTAVMAVEAKQMVTESAGLVYSRDRNGDLIPEKGMFIGKDTYLCLDFDLEKFLKKYSLSTYDVLSCKFSIMGVSRPIRKGYSVYDREGNLFGNYEYDYVNHQYEVDLLALYKKSRNAGFKMLSDLDESFKKDSEQIVLITSKQDFLIKPVLRTDFEVVSLRISSPPEKLFYEPGELFDKNGMVIKGVFSDGEETLLTNYTYLPQIALTKEDIKISIFYEGKKTEQYICIGNKDNAYEPPLNPHSDYGVYIDTLRTEFLNVTAINGQTPVNPGENVEIELPGSVDVEVDLEGLLAANGLNQNPDMSFSLGIFGLLKNGNISYAYVNGYKSNTKIADLKGYNNMYFVPLSKLLAETGSASFRIFINPPKYYDKESDSYKASALHEIFTLQKSFFISEKTSCETYLKVMTPPNKTRYMIGEKFDPIGMKVYEFNTNGFNREVKDYTYSPTESITQNSSIITIEYQGNGNKINLIYTNGKLTEINDTRDRKIKYSYNKDNLDTVTYLDADGVQTKKLEFGYSHVVLDGAGRKVLTGILDYGNNTYSNIRYEDNPVNARVVGIENYSKMTGTVDWNNGSKISAIAFAYDNGKTTVSDEYSNSEIYSFDTRGLLKSVYVLRDNLVTKAENYEYEPYVKQVVKTIAEEHLGVYYYDVFLDIEKQVSTKETLLNKINMPVKVTIDEIPLTNSSNKKVTVEYEYDFEFDLVKQISKEEYSDGSCFKFVTDIDYNYLKLPVKSVKRCYKVVDELEMLEYTEVEERNYDNNGCVALTKNYRYAAGESADDAEVFYVEKAYNDNKQLIRETDDRGLYFNTFNYIKNTNLLSEINGPHGRNVSYRYDGSDRLSEVWAKTDSVNNINTIEYVKGETKSIDHSGKNPIGFAYDDKHRLFTVTLDGTIIENYEYFDNVLIKSANGDA